jgi:sulfur-oxidizing protein SoxX
MNKYSVILLLILGSLFLVYGCERGRTSGKGLYLPKGDVEKGRQAFIDMKCYRCHTVAGVELPKVELATTISFELGGEVIHVKSYGELVTSIVNPAHVTSRKYLDSLGELAKEGKIESPMPSFNEQMTVAQLIDLIAFLDSRYKELQPSYIGSPYGYAPL